MAQAGGEPEREDPAAGGAALRQRVKAWAQYPLPHHWISRLALFLTRRRSVLVPRAIRWFCRRFGADLGEAAHPDPGAYATFNEFFIRELRDGARPLAPAPALLCPVDGTVSALGRLQRDAVVQAKGLYYRLPALLGGEIAPEPFHDGFFATLYLAPYDYHRVHMPATGTLREMSYVPGRLFSVAPFTVEQVPGLFTRNERVVCLFDTERGPLALILVGAMNVAAIETVWSGVITPPRGRRVRHWHYRPPDAVTLARGAEMGRFNMGSTVIVLAPGEWAWEATLVAGATVRLGQTLAHPGAGADAAAGGDPSAGAR